jgi:hypothetical protein
MSASVIRTALNMKVSRYVGRFFVMFGPEFSLNGSGRLRFVKSQTALRALRAGIRLVDDWQDI